MAQAQHVDARDWSKPRGNGKISFYSPGYFPSAKPSAPPIYSTTGRRPKEALEVDRQLREAPNLQALWRFVAQHLPHFDTGNLVVAFTSAAKIDEGAAENLPEVFYEVVERLLSSMDFLEPRGLSMLAYSAAKLLYGDHRLLSQLSACSCRCCHRFGATDVAKATWAFAKLRFVEEEMAQEF
ncbi:unnamed protein product [Durusdinium trenchii]|uniref:Uncharacterized protein n=1 Tax=Durusdinium trenchii TaxID=1381693 RepID=A0ABP0H8U0_9DINO